MKSQFEDSLTVLDSIDSTNPIVIDLVADLKSFFTSQINFINGEIKYCIIILISSFFFIENISALSTVHPVQRSQSLQQQQRCQPLSPPRPRLQQNQTDYLRKQQHLALQQNAHPVGHSSKDNATNIFMKECNGKRHGIFVRLSLR